MKHYNTQDDLENLIALEDKAMGMFVGGLMLTIDADALSKVSVSASANEIAEVEAFLTSIGLDEMEPSVDEMRTQMRVFLSLGANAMQIAARNFDRLTDDDIRILYGDMKRLQKKSAETKG